jgi:phenol 2-monooxygenase
MNVSLQDGYNIGWKLAAVLKGRSDPELLKTYDLEREEVAADLIEFDRAFSKLFSLKPTAGKEDVSKEFSEQFIKAGRYTAGLTTTYQDSSITRATWSNQSMATELKVGMRFPSTQVVRLCDAKAMQLAKALPADGRWRIVIFAGDIRDEAAAQRLNQLADYLTSVKGPVRKFTLSGQDIDSFIESIVILSGERIKIEQEQIPDYFWPVTGKWKIRGKSPDTTHGNADTGEICTRSSSMTKATTVAMDMLMSFME